MKHCYLLLLALVVPCIFAAYVPVHVMLPLDAISNNNQLNNPSQLLSQLQQLQQVGTDGVMTDVWWGLVETTPQVYNWSAYQDLISLVQKANLKIKVIMSFHQCGGNVGDTCDIPLPPWVLSVGDSNPDIFYTDSQGNRDKEYLSSGVDHEALFGGRTAVEIYADYMSSFESTFSSYIGNTISEIQIGLGPAGELRYPSYQLSLWTFPGIGEFQCYDKYLLANLSSAASQNNSWGVPPNNAGSYNNMPSNTGFFSQGTDNNYASSYGQFFLSWYADRLIQHGSDILSHAASIFKGVHIAAKVSGIHWLYNDPSHAAELTAGYKNDLGDGYTPLTNMFARYGAAIDFTCLEMRDSEQPSSCLCAPEELVYQTLRAAQTSNIPYEGENALPRYDSYAYQQIEYESTRVFPISGFDYLRLDDTLLQSDNLNTFAQFVSTMHNSG